MGNPNNAAELEDRLLAAKKEKNLARVPALRRLRNAVRVILVLSAISLPLLLLTGVGLRAEYDLVTQRNLGIVSLTLWYIKAATTCFSLALAILLVVVYLRFLKQFRNGHAAQIRETIELIPRLLLIQFAIFVVSLTVFPALIYRSAEVVLATLLVGAPTLIIAFVYYILIKKYVREAMAELPQMISAIGLDSAQGEYRSLRLVFGYLLGVSIVLVVIGFLAGGYLSQDQDAAASSVGAPDLELTAPR